MLIPPQATALDPRLSLTQYIHTKWVMSEEEQFPNTNSLAQTADGYLWLGTWQGLWRFDGLRLSRWTAPPGETLDDAVLSMSPSHSGGLWIGTRQGLQKLEQNRLTNYSGRFGLAGGITAALWEAPNGNLWMGAVQNGAPGLYLLANQLQTILPNVQVHSLFNSSSDSLWAGVSGGFYNCSIAEKNRGCRPETPVFVRQLTRPGPQGPALELRQIRAVLHDRDGNVWVGTEGRGLYRIRGGAIERFTRRDGLSSDFVEALIEDREGNIWAGTTYGLDRFREPKVARWSTLQGLAGDGVLGVCASQTGDLWVASVGGSIERFHDGPSQRYTPKHGEILSVFEDRSGTLWLGATEGVIRMNHGRPENVPARHGVAIGRVFEIAQDRDGALWMAASEGLGTLRNGSIEKAAIAGLPPGRISQLAATREGELWIGYVDGGIAVIREGRVDRLVPQNGMASGPVQAIFEDHEGGIWVGYHEGVTRYRDGNGTTWTTRDGLPVGGVLGISEDRTNRVWLLTPAGLTVLPADAGKAAARQATAPSLRVYGPGDGIQMKPIGAEVNPRVTITRDGRIWFGTADGLAGIDPASIRLNQVPPPVAIENLAVDGKHAAGSGGPVHGRSVELQYTALSLTAPENTRFRYKLQPVDKSWIDAGTTRRLAFAGLSPGHYRFEVTACNNDGVWNPKGASLEFTIDPRFYQTWWFLGLAACSLALFAWGMHQARMRLLRGRFQLILQERTRLARDMHDTLLQGFAGAVYQMEAASRLMTTSPDRGQERLARALEQADQSLAEARQMLSSLRLSALENQTLAEALRAAGEQITNGTGVRFESTVRGRGRELPYEVQANLYIIGREAISNAATHGNPERIALLFSNYGDAVSLSVRDTGTGFDLDAAESRPDHWGLAGMRERARQIGGVLTITTAPGQGTTVEVRLKKRARKAVV